MHLSRKWRYHFLFQSDCHLSTLVTDNYSRSSLFNISSFSSSPPIAHTYYSLQVTATNTDKLKASILNTLSVLSNQHHLMSTVHCILVTNLRNKDKSRPHIKVCLPLLSGTVLTRLFNFKSNPYLIDRKENLLEWNLIRCVSILDTMN